MISMIDLPLFSMGYGLHPILKEFELHL